MKEHIIRLKPGFHAESGSTFHAFVKDYYEDGQQTKPCTIPWEEEVTSSIILASKDMNNKILSVENAENNNPDISSVTSPVYEKREVLTEKHHANCMISNTHSPGKAAAPRKTHSR